MRAAYSLYAARIPKGISMELVNVRIKQINDTPAAGAVFLQDPSLPGMAPDRYQERLTPGHVVRVPLSFMRKYARQLELALDAKITRPVSFKSERHMIAWLKPALAEKNGIHPDRLKTLNIETYNEMVTLGEEELTAPVPTSDEEKPPRRRVK